MKILHVCQNYYPSKGGPQYCVRHISEKMTAFYMDEVEVATTNSLYDPASSLFKKITPAYEIVNGIPVNRYPFFRWHQGLFKYANKAKAKLTGTGLPYAIGKRAGAPASPQLHRAMDSFDGDVIMATTAAYNFCDYPTWRFKTKKPKPFILYGAIHLHRQPHPLDRTIIRAKQSDCYIANTEFERKNLIAYGLDANKVVTIGCGITIQEFERTQHEINEFKLSHEINNDDVIIGFVGRLEVGKGVAILIDAIRILCKKYNRVKLLLAGGKTEYSKQLKTIIAKENLPIILIENFAEHTKALIFHAINIFILPSGSESFGIVFLEAWACKKPVLAARMGATESLIDEGRNGFLFDHTDTQNLLQKTELLLTDKLLQTTLGENGYQKVLDNYTWEKIIPEYRNAYLLGIENFKLLQHQKKGTLRL